MKPSERFNSLIEYYAIRAALPFERLRKQVEAESSFNPRAVSSCGAMGLLQLMPGTAKDLGCDLPFDPDANLKAGSTYMAKIISEIQIRGSLGFDEPAIYRIALCGYNAGPGYCYTAIRNMKEAGAAQTWEEFKSWFPKATVKGRTPHAKDAIAYAERIVPAA